MHRLCHQGKSAFKYVKSLRYQSLGGLRSYQSSPIQWEKNNAYTPSFGFQDIELDENEMKGKSKNQIKKLKKKKYNDIMKQKKKETVTVETKDQQVVNYEAPTSKVMAKATLTTLKDLENLTTSENGHVYKVQGWVSQVRSHSKKFGFLDCRTMQGMVQVLIEGPLARHILPQLTKESAIEVYFEKVQQHSGQFEIIASHIELVHRAPENYPINADSNVHHLMENGHLHVRSGQSRASVMKARSRILRGFREAFEHLDYNEISPPSLVSTECEGGSTLFELKDYFNHDRPVYLTQSSQLYLETAIPALGNVYCIHPSFRAEKSLTRRHLSEYTHIEAECPWISFDQLLMNLEDLIRGVTTSFSKKDKELFRSISSKFDTRLQQIQQPFMRKTYAECIDILRQHDVRKEEDGELIAYGDDIPDALERQLLTILGNEHILMMTHFPTEAKAFYMQPDSSDPTLTESVDILFPGVGEVVGGSMRIDNEEKLLAAFKREGIETDPFYWYIDQRKYGSVPHGGFGLGLERYIMWLLDLDHVRETTLYPRFMGRCSP